MKSYDFLFFGAKKLVIDFIPVLSTFASFLWFALSLLSSYNKKIVNVVKSAVIIASWDVVTTMSWFLACWEYN